MKNSCKASTSPHEKHGSTSFFFVFAVGAVVGALLFWVVPVATRRFRGLQGMVRLEDDDIHQGPEHHGQHV